MNSFKPPGQCPVCGEWVPRGVAACDDCGACERSGWKTESSSYDGTDLPDENFDYDDFIRREFGVSTSPGSASLSKEQFWRLVAAILLVVIVLGYLIAAR